MKNKLPFLNTLFLSLLMMVWMSASLCEAAVVTSPFGWRIHPISGEKDFHTGIDIAYEEGTPIVAMMDGRCVYSAVYGGYGNCIILEHDNGDHTLYAHCLTLIARYGQSVRRGETIAAVGNTGISTGPHLHLEWWHQGKYVDPLGLWKVGNISEHDN